MFIKEPLSPKTEEFIRLNGFKEATPIQSRVIPVALKHKDLIAISATGTGKSHAFFIPLMEMIDSNLDEVQAVITTPTRELAAQIWERAQLMTKADPKLRIRLVIGGMDKTKASNKKSPHLVIGTPGRIKDLFLQETVLRVDSAKVFVVDEADMTLEYGFLEDIDAICSRMPDSLQMMVFSATIPEGLKPFLKKYMKHPQTIRIDEKSSFDPQIEHVLVPCRHKSYEETLLEILPGFMPYVCLIFANTRQEAASCTKALRKKGYAVTEIHGGMEARKRKQALRELAGQRQTFVVATDIASRGMDIEAVTHVVSLGFPSELSFYIHRAGRTGRAGRQGTCFALYQEKDEPAIRTLMDQGVRFKHRSFRQGNWKDLKPFGFVRKRRDLETEKEIARTLSRKNEKVKPGYKKKKAAAVQKIKQKKKRAMIQKKIKEERVERYKAAQRQKRRGETS